ncbi:hypothetical protein [Candidatus Formimonas warabiya]|uniref:Uncharacterized protein n=1 Tax=Formimonas warabiya TaxID=1761012 RepID=A0A3G1KNX4_FORW1|nr:hypothetical protein [Candidatus Formimonas warabiya]ATW24181.1 hypothetical protein DCMF_04725 [Candidatus Formimonas warabiya]
MTQYAQPLNQDQNTKLTSSFWDANVTKWVQATQGYALNTGGILVPLKSDDSGNLKNDVIDRAARLLGKITSDDGAIATLGALANAAVTDPTASGSVVALLKGALTDLGQISDAVVTAGATGSLSAKIRRLSTDLNDLLTRIGEVQASPTANTALDRLKTLATVLGTVADAAVTDPAASGSQTALLKGIIKQFQGAGSGAAPVKPVGNDSLLQGNLILTGAAQQLNAASVPSKIVTPQAHPENKGYVYVGKSDINPNTPVYMFVLSPGSSITVTCSNLNLLWVWGTAGEKLSYGGEV